tara:strand:+ start:590 stop:958 length:369 start_codon:yes stop_codon:yes gene_type:complete
MATWKPEMMKVEITSSNISGIYLDPISAKRRKQYDRLVIEEHRQSAPQMHTAWQRESTEDWLTRFPLVLVQVDHEAEQVLEDLHLTQAQKDDISSGWPVRIMVQVDTFNHLFSCYCQIDMGY